MTTVDPITGEVLEQESKQDSYYITDSREETSEKTDKILKALSKASDEIEPFVPDAVNEHLNNTRYVKSVSIMKYAHRALRKVWVYVRYNQDKVISDMSNSKIQYLSILSLTATHIESGQFIKLYFTGIKVDKKEITLYSAVTLAKKNLLMNLLNIEVYEPDDWEIESLGVAANTVAPKIAPIKKEDPKKEAPKKEAKHFR